MATSQTIEKATDGATADTASATRRTIATYRDDTPVERAVDYLSGCGTDREIAGGEYGEVPSGQVTGQPSPQGPRREHSGSAH